MEKGREVFPSWKNMQLEREQVDIRTVKRRLRSKYGNAIIIVETGITGYTSSLDFF